MPDIPNNVFPEGVQVRNAQFIKEKIFVSISLAPSTTTSKRRCGRTWQRGQRSSSDVR